mmetsp:Transcript_31041/g.51895  ORF Transcript_31041/g.51895 Transcript_31041/m.51895 type:complete len:422 (+) Transcript_31041:46-1311(+)
MILLFIVLAVYQCSVNATSSFLNKEGIRLKTSTFISLDGLSGRQLHDFLATPTNWPRIVASSHSVRAPPRADTRFRGVQPRRQQKLNEENESNLLLAVPMDKGAKVDEIFGLPPILPLSVRWECVENTYPCLKFESAEGLNGIASNCTMTFMIRTEPLNGKEEHSRAKVDFKMTYIPSSAIAVLATPILALDNTLAIKVLLHRALRQNYSVKTSTTSELDKFRNLMGILYGVAGLAHLFDLLIGPSTLLVAAGIPPYQQLPAVPGKLLAWVWSLVGPVAYLCTQLPHSSSSSSSSGSSASASASPLSAADSSNSTTADVINGRVALLNVADFGLFLYGAIEVGCAALAQAVYSGSSVGGSFGINTSADIDVIQASATMGVRVLSDPLVVVSPLVNAVVVQCIVFLSWLYSSQRSQPLPTRD